LTVKILITGGNSLIAQSIAFDRIARGDSVVLTAASLSSLSQLETTCRRIGQGATCLLFDLLSPDECSAGCDGMLAEIDGLILNAATPTETRDVFHRLPRHEVDAAIDGNIKGNVYLLRKALPGMQERKFGRIVFISSVSAVMGTAHYGAYCLHKAAIEGLIFNLAVDYARDNVLANIVRLGIFRTARTEEFWGREKYVRRVAGVIPQGEFGDPGSIPDAIAPLLSVKQYMNGSVVTIAGGLPLVRPSLLGILEH
jgi:3-oxoacyl-[acyl-carrier protein] reductase